MWLRNQYTGSGGGLYTGPGDALYTGPGGGLYTEPSGGMYAGPDDKPYTSNIPPWDLLWKCQKEGVNEKLRRF